MRRLILLPLLFHGFFGFSQAKDKFPATDIVIKQKNGYEHHLLYQDGFFLNYKKGGAEVYVIEAGSNERLDYDIKDLTGVSFFYENKQYDLKPFRTEKEKKYLLLDSVLVTERVSFYRTPGNDYITQYYFQDIEGVVHPIDKSLNELLVFLNCFELEERYTTIENRLLTQKEIKNLILEYEELCK